MAEHCLTKLKVLEKENQRLRDELARCLSSCKTLRELKELLNIIRRLEERLERLSTENEKLRNKLKQCSSLLKESETSNTRIDDNASS